MAEPLKHFFSEGIVRVIAADLHRVYPAFPERRFVEDCMTGLDDLALLARGWRIAEALHEHLPKPFPAAVDIIIASLGPELEGTDGFGMAPFRYLPHVLFVQKYGLDDFEPAMVAQRELTKRFSSESSIRAFLVRYPEATYARLADCSPPRVRGHAARAAVGLAAARVPGGPSTRDGPRPLPNQTLGSRPMLAALARAFRMLPGPALWAANAKQAWSKGAIAESSKYSLRKCRRYLTPASTLRSADFNVGDANVGITCSSRHELHDSDCPGCTALGLVQTTVENHGGNDADVDELHEIVVLERLVRDDRDRWRSRLGPGRVQGDEMLMVAA